MELCFTNIKEDISYLPYIHGSQHIEYDEKEGFITFYGYYRVEDKPPPYEEDQKLEMHRRPRRYSQSLPKQYNLYIFSKEEQKAFAIEIYKRIFHDEPGPLLNKQTIYFRILERF